MEENCRSCSNLRGPTPTNCHIKHKRELTTLPVLRYSSGHRKGRLEILYLWREAQTPREQML